jgi:acyl-coenzyme A thioesterase PaaI-like protein
MAESLQSRLTRWGFNRFRAFRGTGGRITYIANDWREVRLKIPLSRRTRNYVGTIYGGSMYGAVDPIYMVMLIQLLGPEYVVWDRSASITFKRPGRSTLSTTFSVPVEETDDIRAALQTARSLDRTYTIDLVDSAGQIHATIEKVLYIRRKDHPAEASRAEAASAAAHWRQQEEKRLCQRQ